MTKEQRIIDEGAQSFMRMTADMIDAIRARHYDEVNFERRMARFRDYNLRLALSSDQRLVTLAAVNNSIIAALREMAEGRAWKRYKAEKRLCTLARSWQRLMNEVMGNGV